MLNLNFPEPKVTSQYVLFCPTSSPKLKHIHFKKQIWEAECRELLAFLTIKWLKMITLLSKYVLINFLSIDQPVNPVIAAALDVFCALTRTSGHNFLAQSTCNSLFKIHYTWNCCINFYILKLHNTNVCLSSFYRLMSEDRGK